MSRAVEPWLELCGNKIALDRYLTELHTLLTLPRVRQRVDCARLILIRDS